jgi:hypothetical protein
MLLLLKLLFSAVMFLLMPVAIWRTFEKAGQWGWVGLIPILQFFGLLKMAGKPFWWIVFFIPPLTPFALFFACLMVARRFGKSSLFGVGMFFLPIWFVPVLGFGSARYLGASR